MEMTVGQMKAILAKHPDDAKVFLMAKSRSKQYDNLQVKEHKVVNDDGDWIKVSPKENGEIALVFVPE